MLCPPHPPLPFLHPILIDYYPSRNTIFQHRQPPMSEPHSIGIHKKLKNAIHEVAAYGYDRLIIKENIV